MNPRRQTPAELRALQRLMARAVMRPLTAQARMRPQWSDGRPTATVADGFIKPGPQLSSFERLEIYNRQYWFRVFECLADDYSGVRAVIGAKKFGVLAVAYLATHPSQRFTLRDLGRHLPAFILAEPRWTAPRTALAGEMARLEWSHIEAFDNEEKPPLTLQDLAGRDVAELRLRLQPHITLLQLNWPLDEYLIALAGNTRWRGEASNAKTAPSRKRRGQRLSLPKSEMVHLAVHRYQNKVYYKRLNSAQFKLLSQLQRWKRLTAALASCFAADEIGKHAPARQVVSDCQSAAPSDHAVQNWFKDWSSLGWFWVK